MYVQARVGHGAQQRPENNSAGHALEGDKVSQRSCMVDFPMKGRALDSVPQVSGS